MPSLALVIFTVLNCQVLSVALTSNILKRSSTKFDSYIFAVEDFFRCQWDVYIAFVFFYIMAFYEQSLFYVSALVNILGVLN